MKWRKLGKIFDPTDFKLPNDCFGYAQSPQPLLFDDYVRIYFSTRQKDTENGKHLSHIAYVDIKRDFKEIIGISSHRVIELGRLGCYDEHGIFPLNVLRRGTQIYGYICGWNRRASVSVDTSIGLAISSNQGKTFEKIGDGPVLSSSPNEPYLVGDPFVGVYNNVFHMWYIFGTCWKTYEPNQPPDRIYKIGHAISKDGIRWVKEEDGKQIIADRLGEDECQALPTVAYFNGRYYMFFCYRYSQDFRTNRNRSYRIGYAVSDNLQDWIRKDQQVGIDVSEGQWDSDMLCYPHVFACDGQLYLLYNGNEFGRYGFGLAVLEEEGWT